MCQGIKVKSYTKARSRLAKWLRQQQQKQEQQLQLELQRSKPAFSF